MQVDRHRTPVSGSDGTDDVNKPCLPTAEILICVKCRRGQDMPADAERPGAALLAAIAARGLPAGLRVTPVECLSNCDRGCTIALRGAGRWTYVYGNLEASSDIDALLDGATRYRDAADGLVPWRERPEHFRRNCIARIPPQEDPLD